jgi:transposase
MIKQTSALYENEETITYKRRKSKIEKTSKDIRHERVIHNLSDTDKFYDCCQHPLHQVGEDTNEKLSSSFCESK